MCEKDGPPLSLDQHVCGLGKSCILYSIFGVCRSRLYASDSCLGRFFLPWNSSIVVSEFLLNNKQPSGTDTIYQGTSRHLVCISKHEDNVSSLIINDGHELA